MQLPVVPRVVSISDAALFVGITPGTIRDYHRLGLLPEPESSTDEQSGYGHEDVIRLLWIRRMIDAGIAPEDIRDIFAEPDRSASGKNDAVVQRLRTPEGRLSLLTDFVRDRFKSLPPDSLRQAYLDILLVTERIFGPLGAAVQASRFIALATHPALQAESDRVDAAEEALDDAVAVDDPRVAQTAAERHAFELALNSVLEESGLAQNDDDLFDAWDALHPAGADEGQDDDRDSGAGAQCLSVGEAIAKMPYDFSPARLRCMELSVELAAREVSGA